MSRTERRGGMHTAGFPWFATGEEPCTERPEAFFAPDNERTPARDQREQAAKDLCASCDVRTRCAEYALAAGPGLYGVWGGMNEDERSQMRAAERRSRRQQEAAT